jgi:hypothetical protein
MTGGIAVAADELVEWYWNIEVGVSEWATNTASINKYKTGRDESGPTWDARNAVRSAAQLKHLFPDNSAFQRANYGKVSPLDCEHILTLAVDTGVVKPEKIQSWANTNLGVDCTGFAVAYYDWLGIINRNTYSGGISCPVLVSKAKNNNRASDGGPLLWSLDDVAVDDFIVWMNEAGKETRAPGHIAVIYDVDYNQGILYTAESSGSNDGDGHSGPRLDERTWTGVHSAAPRYIELDHADQVLIVRTPPIFG